MTHFRLIRDTSSSESEESSDSSGDELIGPPLPPKMVGKPVNFMDEDILGTLPPPLNEEEEAEEEEEEEEEEENPVHKIPDSHEITLKHGTKTVSALGLDPSGARLVTGGYDYDVKFWDFAGMDASFKAFRSLQPCECHQIKSLQYSNTGDMILVVSGSSQAKVIDRDGFEVMECIKGDQYIVDMANTKGHTAMLHTGSWHPKIKGEFMTCSNDATVRTWEVENPKKQKSVFKPRTMQGKKVIPTTCTYSRDGNLIAAACQNGSIQIWDRNLTPNHCSPSTITEDKRITFKVGLMKRRYIPGKENLHVELFVLSFSPFVVIIVVFVVIIIIIVLTEYLL
ncbi:hypothetical protein H8958_017060 [Nasalis larvatus]